jgi:3alpha(or 20beta)-hydroxysteroid dehydrogenase
MGGEVVATDIDDGPGEAVCASIDGLQYRHLDVSDEGQWRDLVASMGAVDILINNAGIHHSALIEYTPLAVFERLYQVNQRGTFLGIKAVIPAMKRARGGSIINVSSSAGLIGLPTLVAYSATKFAVRGMTKVAALELSSHNIRVNTVHPGKIDDQAVVEPYSSLPADRPFPMGRPARVAEVCNLVAFLASDASSYCSGGEFTVDGASTAGRLNYPRSPPASPPSGSGSLGPSGS